MIHLINLIVIFLICSFGNRIRGGGFESFKLKDGVIKEVLESQTFWRLIIVSTSTYSFIYPLGWCGIPQTIIIFLTFFYFGLVAGWGTWFKIKVRDGWRHNLDAEWVEFIMSFYGKHWIPAQGVTVRKNSWLGRLTVEESPTGNPRELDWYIVFNFLAMSLRGLGLGVAITILTFCIYGETSQFYLFSSMLMGWCYYVWFHLEEKKLLKYVPKFLKGSTHLGEFLYGGLILGVFPYINGLILVAK